MGSQWTSKYNIMRDLSMVQGRVPADIDNTLTSGDKPPAVTLTEETEEEFFRNCTGDGDIAAPDLGLIRQMLDIVREIDESSDTEDVENLNNVIQLSKLDPMTPDFVPRNLDHTSPKLKKSPEKTPHKKKSTRQNRNVALTSILELAGSIVEKGIEQKTLTNSVDVSPNVTASLKKVNGWLEAQQKHGTEKNLCVDQLSKKKITSPKESDKLVNSLKHTKLVQSLPKDPKDILSLDPSTMFRKKVSPKVAAVVECNKTTVKSLQGCEKYVPSSNADEYYKKYLERSKVHAMVHDDVWTRAERQMKEIDERRRLEAELFQQSYAAAQLAQSPQSAQSETSNQTYTISTEPGTILNESPAMRRSPDILSGSSTILSGSPAILNESPVISPAPSATKPVQGPWDLTTAEEQRLAVVILPYHRHILTQNCIVCKVCQKSQDDKAIYVIDADDRRLLKSKHKDDFDEIGGPTWRDDEHLREWHYDDETNSWHKSNDEPKPREKKEKEPTHKNNGEVQLWRKNDRTIKNSEKSDMDKVSNRSHDDVRRNNELHLCRPENDITYIEGTMGNNELEYCSFESLEAISQ